MNRLVIYVQEEYGYRDWLWLPDMNLEEVKEWWKKLDSVDPFFFSGPTTFPGQVQQIYFRNEKEFQFVQEDDPLDSEADNRGRVVYTIHDELLTLPDDCVRMHIHEDHDSWLTVGDEVLHHAGYTVFGEEESHD